MKKSHMALAAALGTMLVGGAFVGVGVAGQGPMHHASEERFKAMDKDGDGKISAAEFETHHSAKLMESDLDGDGKVTYDELKAAREKRREERAQAFFKSLDTDGDGAVTEAELKARPDPMFAKLDANKDGLLSADEIKAARGKWDKHHHDHGPDDDKAAEPN